MVQGLIAMKPRQVLLSSSSAKALSGGRPLSLTAEQRPLLLQAICDFLESKGFSKTLKKFLSEASLERDSSKNCILNLEHACCMYLDARPQIEADENNNSSDKGPEKIIDDDANVKSKEKKNKKSGKDSSTQNGEVESEVASADAVCDEKSSKKAKDKKKKKGSEPAAEPVNEKAKDKKKKKGSEPADEPVKENLQSSCAENGNKESIEAEKSMKSKSERKKNKGGKVDDAEDKGLGSKEGLGEGAEQDKKKSSKKRKKSSSEEDKSDDIGAAPEDSKRRKTAGSDDNLGSQLKNGQMDSQTPASVIGKHSEMLADDDVEDKSALKKSSAKKQNGSTEPRTQNAFQRVKADEVEFADEKLQDNSYWAKDGAEVGYGAKAQEVLGQVRGRDFRHEKTKKKRGSYRGGLIDLQSHSVKFNYSDNDE